MSSDAVKSDYMEKQKSPTVDENEGYCSVSKELVTTTTNDDVLDWISECMNENVENPNVLECKDQDMLSNRLKHNENLTDSGNKLTRTSNLTVEKVSDAEDDHSLDENQAQCFSDFENGDKESLKEQNREIVSPAENQDRCLEYTDNETEDENCSQLSENVSNELKKDSFQVEDGSSNEQHIDEDVNRSPTCSADSHIEHKHQMKTVDDPKEDNLSETEICEDTLHKKVDDLPGGELSDVIAEPASVTGLCDSDTKVMFCENVTNSVSSTNLDFSLQSDTGEEQHIEEFSHENKNDFVFSESDAHSVNNLHQENVDDLSQEDLAGSTSSENVTENYSDDLSELNNLNEASSWKDVKNDVKDENTNCSLNSEIKVYSEEKIDRVASRNTTSLLDVEQEIFGYMEQETSVDSSEDIMTEGKCEIVTDLSDQDSRTESNEKEATEAVNEKNTEHVDIEKDASFVNTEEESNQRNQDTLIEQIDVKPVLLETGTQKKIHKRRFDSYTSNRNKSKRNYKKKKSKAVKKPKFSKQYDSEDTEDYVTDEDVKMGAMEYCSYCNYSTAKKQAFLEHIAKHTGDRPFKCQKCDFCSKTRGDLQKHQAKHATVATHRCKIEGCSFATKWPRNLSHHMSSHSNERPHSCEICGFRFKRKQDLRYHMFRHNDEKPKVCDQCDFCCKTNYELKLHLLKHTDERNFACTHPGCTQKTKTKSDLKKHMIVHSKTREAICELCGKGFKDKTALKKHKERHDDRRLFACDLCNKHFKTKAAVKLHLKVHEGIKPFKCEVCDHSFLNKFNKAQHMKVHGENRPYQCPICPYGARTADHLLAHIGSMHGDTYAYFCELCRKPYKRYQQLRLHYQRMHTKKELEIFKIDPTDTAIFLTGLTFQNESTGQKYDLVNLKHEENKATRLDTHMESDAASSDVKVENNLADATVVSLESNMILPSTSEPVDQVTTEGDYSVMDTEAGETSDKQDIKATLAMYGGFRLPLAKKGFKFNFEKPGKKPKSWFMDPKLMDKDSAVRYKNYLKRKGIHPSKRVTKRVGSDEDENPIYNKSYLGLQKIPKVSLTRVDGEFKTLGPEEGSEGKMLNQKGTLDATSTSHQSSSGIKYAENIFLKECSVRLFDIKYFFADCLVEEEKAAYNKETKAASSKCMKMKISKKALKKPKGKSIGKSKNQPQNSTGNDVHSKKRKNSKTPNINLQSNFTDNREQQINDNTNVNHTSHSKDLHKKIKSKELEKKSAKKVLKNKFKNTGEKVVKKVKASEKQGISRKGKEAKKIKKSKKCGKKAQLNIRLPTYLQKSSAGKEYSNKKWCSKDKCNKSTSVKNKSALNVSKNISDLFLSVKQENDFWNNCTSESGIEISSTGVNRQTANPSPSDMQIMQINNMPNNTSNDQCEILNCSLQSSQTDLQTSLSNDKPQKPANLEDQVLQNNVDNNLNCNATILVNDVTSNKTVWKHTVTECSNFNNSNSNGLKKYNKAKRPKSTSKRTHLVSDELNISASPSFSMSKRNNGNKDQSLSKGNDVRDDLEIHINLVDQDPPRHVIDLQSTPGNHANTTKKRKGKKSENGIAKKPYQNSTLAPEENVETRLDVSSVGEMVAPGDADLNLQSLNGPSVSTSGLSHVSNENTIQTEQQNTNPIVNDSMYPMYPMFPMYSMYHPMYSVRTGIHPFMPSPTDIASRCMGKVGNRAMYPRFPVRTNVHNLMNVKDTAKSQSNVAPTHMVNPLMYPRYPLGMNIRPMMNTGDRTVEKETSKKVSKNKSSKPENMKSPYSKGDEFMQPPRTNVTCANEQLGTECSNSDEPSVTVEMKPEPPMDIEYLRQAYM